MSFSPQSQRLRLTGTMAHAFGCDGYRDDDEAPQMEDFNLDDEYYELMDTLIDRYDTPEPSTDRPNPSPNSIRASSPTVSIDAVSNLERSSSPTTSPPAGPACATLGLSREEKRARRIARKNRARLHRYRQSQAELVELRGQAAELRECLDELKKKNAHDEQGCELSELLALSPSPFADNEDDEVDPRAEAPPKARRITASGASSSSWKDAAKKELGQRRRAEAVRRKLTRISIEFEQRCELYRRACAQV